MKCYFKKMMLVVAIAISTASIAQQEYTSHATIKGRLQKFGNMIEVEDFSELQYLVPKASNMVIIPNADSTFHIEIPLSKPNYFRIGRNKVFLSPGDDLEVVLNADNSSLSTFKGIGSVANNFLSNTAFPKGGSYLEAGKNLLETPLATLNYILDEGKRRNKMLSNLKQVSEEFKQAEYARIKADMLISMKAVPSYTRFSNKPDSLVKPYMDEFNNLAAPYKDSLLENFIHADFLKIESYRDYISYVDFSKAKNAKDTIQIHDWKNAVMLATGKIKPENNKEALKTFEPDIASIATKKYRDALNVLIREKLKFGNGDKAIDFDVRNNDGNTSKLSSLKGKLIYVDIWATWCGPCMAEMPKLEELKEKYKHRNDLAIVSLSVDSNDEIWFKNLEKRKPLGIQWRIDRAMLGDYDVVAIPRYILITKDFVVAELNAPRPTDNSFEEMLLKYLD